MKNQMSEMVEGEIAFISIKYLKPKTIKQAIFVKEFFKDMILSIIRRNLLVDKKLYDLRDRVSYEYNYLKDFSKPDYLKLKNVYSVFNNKEKREFEEIRSFINEVVGMAIDEFYAYGIDNPDTVLNFSGYLMSTCTYILSSNVLLRDYEY